jgi:hypothetical protein
MLVMLANCRCFLWSSLLALASGCAICGSCDDYTYGSYGGRWTRLDPCFGRVGSAFTPEAGTQVLPDELVPPEPEEVQPGIATPLESSTLETPPTDDSAPTPPTTLEPELNTMGADASVLRNPVEALR